ncbi:CAZyme family PL4 [Penicillium daleae]|uniref:CAZyme family PL4 n=1 Tax=Penicillium daleae TaxID=63821 RepID=A0AAD6C8N5_9EURO|nr:CAZyme family PL4 [Penicillium daleae]KAJ5450818.1 CAZyme family PL4 [Penicillium daleae]
MILTDTYTPTGQQFQQYWFLRDGETGLHMFSRLSYYETTPFLRNLQELPDPVPAPPLPSKDAVSHEVVVQDATWTFNNTTTDAYYAVLRLFHKYTFSNRKHAHRHLVRVEIGPFIDILLTWRNSSVHGLYADGTNSSGTHTRHEASPDTKRRCGRLPKYWVDIGSDGSFALDRVKEGKYRVTIYAEGISGDFIRDGIVTDLQANFATDVPRTPHIPQLPEYMIYWGAHDWTHDFPDGINYTIGKSDPAIDLNTVHWSVFGPTSSNHHVEYDTTYDWNIHFKLDAKQLRQRKTATLTVQLAGAKIAAGNTDVWNPAVRVWISYRWFLDVSFSSPMLMERVLETYNNLSLESYINDHLDPLTLMIGFNQSSSCIVRSAVSCYQVSSRMSFPANWLPRGRQPAATLSPFQRNRDTETAIACLETVYVQYDALRLEVK